MEGQDLILGFTIIVAITATVLAFTKNKDKKLKSRRYKCKIFQN